MGIELRPTWHVAKDENNPGDATAAEEARELSFGIFSDVIYKGEMSSFVTSRLGARAPSFTTQELQEIKGIH